MRNDIYLPPPPERPRFYNWVAGFLGFVDLLMLACIGIVVALFIVAMLVWIP